jgi:two-component system NarL family response regulator
MTQERIGVLCVDDHRLVRQGIASLIDQEPDMEVVASAASGEEAVALFRHYRPDVVLMDLQLPGMSGLEAMRSIRIEQPSARIIVLTVHQGEEDIFRAMAEGATSYLLKDTLFDELADRIRRVHAGEHSLPADVETLLAERKGHRTLSPRELQIVELLAKGMRNKEIAVTLDMSETTVQVHLRNMFKKLGVGERTGAIAVAVRRGLIHLR